MVGGITVNTDARGRFSAFRRNIASYRKIIPIRGLGEEAFLDVFPNDTFRPYTVFVFQRGHRLLVTSFSTAFHVGAGAARGRTCRAADLASSTPRGTGDRNTASPVRAETAFAATGFTKRRGGGRHCRRPGSLRAGHDRRGSGDAALEATRGSAPPPSRLGRRLSIVGRLMVTLRPMDANEFARWLPRMRASYAQDIAVDRGASENEAQGKATAEIEQLFPGVSPPTTSSSSSSRPVARTWASSGLRSARAGEGPSSGSTTST